MLKLDTKIDHGVDQDQVDYHLTLPFELRQKARFKTQLDEGGEVGLFLQHGNVLQHGDLLQSDNGKIVRILAAREAVSEVRCSDPLLLAKLCYHLGNRHVALQIGKDFVRYQPDHVLDHLVSHFFLSVTATEASFEPEIGAYHKHSHEPNSHSHEPENQGLESHKHGHEH